MAHKRSENLDALIATVAARQNGNITVRQLLAIGLTRPAILHRTRTGRLFRVFARVYAVGRPAVTPLERASAAVLAGGSHAVLSHDAALALWGVRRRWPSMPTVTLTAGDRRPQGISVHQCRLSRTDTTVQLHVPVTSLARTVLDCAPTTPPTRLSRLINDALLSPYLTENRLAEAISSYPLHPGTKLVRPHVVDGDRTRSDLEDAFLGFCRRFKLPRPQTNVIVNGREVDALFAAERVIVEVDGWRIHRHRRSFRKDRRDDAIAAAAGYMTVRITDDRLVDPEAPDEAARLHAILESRRR